MKGRDCMFGRKKAKQVNENLELLRRLDGREVKYVTLRSASNYEETILGRDGKINVMEEELNIVCGTTIVFQHTLEGLEGAEFMSMDGINLRYTCSDTGEKETVIAYYKYHRK